jgi:succinyl-CoA synthetase alpha subunit
VSILVNRETRLLVQGITGREGAYHTTRMVEYGTRVVAGVTPGRRGEDVAGVPVFDSIREAVRETGANASIIFVPALAAADAIVEAADGGIPLIVCVTEGLPTLDVIRALGQATRRGARVIGPNCPGIITPGEAKVGIMPGDIHRPGPVAVVSRSGTLTYEVVKALSDRGIGQSTCIGIGGDPVIGTSFTDVLEFLRADEQTRAVALVGEIGGNDEERAAELIAAGFGKPVVAFIAGRSAPAGRRMGHAGAIIDGGAGDAESKMRALTAAGAVVVERPTDVAAALAELLSATGSPR